MLNHGCLYKSLVYDLGRRIDASIGVFSDKRFSSVF